MIAHFRDMCKKNARNSRYIRMVRSKPQLEALAGLDIVRSFGAQQGPQKGNSKVPKGVTAAH